MIKLRDTPAMRKFQLEIKNALAERVKANGGEPLSRVQRSNFIRELKDKKRFKALLKERSSLDFFFNKKGYFKPKERNKKVTKATTATKAKDKK